MERRIVALFFITLLLSIAVMYIIYVREYGEPIWLGGLLLFGGTSFNWYLYDRLCKK